MQLIPEPKKVKSTAGNCPIDIEAQILIGEGDLPSEGYQLTISPDAITIEARDPAGAFYGTQTLEQLRELSDGTQLDCQKISDHPDFPVRGYMLDISRDRVPTMDHLRRLIDMLAKLRYNQLQLYTEHTFAYAGHETVWGMASPMTADEIESLDAYCQERHIELVANQNSFGHMERWLKHPEYQHLAECPDGFDHPSGERRTAGSVLRPNEQSLQFLGELYAELLPHFSSHKINIGGDEPWELGLGWSAPLVEVEGKHTVYVRFLRRICELAEQHGAQALCWADILLEHPEFIDELPKTVTPIIWGYEPNHAFDRQCEVFSEADHPFYVAPGDSTWNSFTGRFRSMIENVRSATRHALRHKAKGVLMTHWGDNGHQQPWPTAFPGMVACGLFSWNGDAPSNLDIKRQINHLFFRDENDTAAGILLELSDLDHPIPVKLPNQSFLSASVRMNPPELKAKLEDCPDTPLNDLITQTWEWEAALSKCKLEAPDAPWLIEELSWMIAMSRWAAQRCLAIKTAPSIENFSLSSSLKSDLSHLIGVFETTWVCRSRVGGLVESSGRLRTLLAE
ncbi:MAG: family 20 glycosylhydrolase [Verrucomicrobiota bacterium]